MQTLWFLLAAWGHVALWVEFNNRTHGFGWPRKLVDVLTVASALLFVALPAWALGNVATESTLGTNLLCAYGSVCAVVAILSIGSRVRMRWDPEHDKNVRTDRVEVIDLSGVTCCPGVLEKIANLPGNELLRLRVEHRTHSVTRLPKELEGLRIAHLTDLHMSGRIGIEFFQEVVRLVNAWGADLVCITGDIVERTPQLDWIDLTLGQLESHLGSFFILGNHDAKIDHDEMRRQLVAAGIVDLGGQHTTVTHDSGAQILLCGDERPWFDGEPAPLPTTEVGLSIGLVHTPDRFGWATSKDVDFVLAGHNHGGQVCFPLLGPLLCPSRHGVRYAAGSFRRKSTAMHVSRGTGSLFPLRYLCPPELGFITLSAADSP